MYQEKVGCTEIFKLRKNIKRNLFFFQVILVLFSGFCPVFAESLSETTDKEVLDLIKNIAPRRTEGEWARYLLYEQEYDVKENGAANKVIHAVLKVFDNKGKVMADVAIPFNSQYQTCSVQTARTVQEDGQVVTLSQNAIQEKTVVEEFPQFSDPKILRFTLPSVKVGSVLEYKVIIKDTKPVIDGVFFVDDPLEFGAFFSLIRMKIRVPQKIEAKFFVKGLPEQEKQPVIEQKDDQKIYSWEWKNFIQIRGWESLRPPDREVGAFIAFTTIQSWDDVAVLLKRMIEGQDAVSPEISAEVKKLIVSESGNVLSKEEILKRLFYFVSQKITPVGVDLSFSLGKAYPAGEVLSNLYGDSKAKALLLIAMLKEAGIKSYCAFLRTSDEGSLLSDIPSPFEFNHCVVAVPQDSGYLFLDPTPEFIKYDQLMPPVQGVDAFILTEEGFKFVKTPEVSSAGNSTASSMTIKISRDGTADVISKTNSTGFDDLLARSFIKSSNKSSRENIFGLILGDAYPGGGRLLEFKSSDVDNLDEPLTVETHYQIADFLKKIGDSFAFNLPSPSIVLFKSITGGQYRKNDVWLPYVFQMASEYTIEIPPGYEIKYVPEDLKIDLPFASYSCVFKREGNKLNASVLTEMKTKVVSAGKFGQFKNFVEKIFKYSSESILLIDKEVIVSSTGS
ncbi:MAG: DUF3857 domain-containing protein [Candidatus Omnitrophica bacterium]|nr:DUF3857 domain-containing protein [Candidatus Omnitrophota bacterium]